MSEKPHINRGKISIRFRNMNILLFIAAFCIAAAVMTFAFNNVITTISSQYAGNYAASTSEALSAHTIKEIGLMSKAAHSGAVIEWLNDEDNEAKRDLAFAEMSGIVGELYSFNLYVVSDASRKEYGVGLDHSTEYIAVLDEHRPIDAWYFECINSKADYILSIDIDHFMQRKRVWLDYKVVSDGLPVGVICTGLEFSHVAGELFSHYDSNNMRGLIVDRNGLIQMDSSLMDDKNFLHDTFERPYTDEFDDPAIKKAVESHIRGAGNYFSEIGQPDATKLSSGQYRFMTIAPIRYTDWSVLILSGPSTFFNMSYFIPVTITFLALLLAFAISTSLANYKLIFSPLSKLDQSIASLRNSNEEELYGTNRDDELGQLSKTIKDLFHKANFDALTSIYNRRYMETSLVHIMELLSRSNDLLSVFMLDIDHFKKYNDNFGHDQGDECLRSVASALASCITRAGDFAARYGGEEFIAVLPSTDEAGARNIAEKLLESVRALEIPHPHNTAAPHVTVSIGFTTGKVSHTQNWEEYVKRADDALYKSKKHGRNQYNYLPFEKDNYTDPSTDTRPPPTNIDILTP